jgi:hypothetical protein
MASTFDRFVVIRVLLNYNIIAVLIVPVIAIIIKYLRLYLADMAFDTNSDEYSKRIASPILLILLTFSLPFLFRYIHYFYLQKWYMSNLSPVRSHVSSSVKNPVVESIAFDADPNRVLSNIELQEFKNRSACPD